MRKISFLIMALLLAMPAEAKGRVPKDKALKGYVMVYHKDADHGLHMAYSWDGYVWTALNDDKPVMGGDTIAEQHGIRDPYIFRSPDGGFCVAMTDLHVFGMRDGFRTTQWERPQEYEWGNNRGLVLLKSFDMIHWKRTNLDFTKLTASDPLMPDWKHAGCVWAPEMVYDEEAGHIMMHFTTRNHGGPNMIYYVYMNDDFDTIISDPKPLFTAPLKEDGMPSYNIIDSDIIKVGDTCHLFYVSHQKGATVKHATSKSVTGPFVMDELYNDGEKQGHEAPNIWKRIHEDSWTLMFDNYSRRPHNFGFVTTEDFRNFKMIGYFDDPTSPMKRTNFSEQKHGAVISVTKKELKRLIKAWQ